MRVVNFGSLNIDYVYRVDHFVRPGETMSAKSLQVQCGGKGLNQSVALARAGVETWHAGLIGPEGRFLKETLDRAGVHTRFVEETAGRTQHRPEQHPAPRRRQRPADAGVCDGGAGSVLRRRRRAAAK